MGSVNFFDVSEDGEIRGKALLVKLPPWCPQVALRKQAMAHSRKTETLRRTKTARMLDFSCVRL